LVNYAWFDCQIFHASVRLKSGHEGLLVDCGAIGNLAGDRWVARCALAAKKHGLGTQYSQLQGPLDIGGVGKNNQTATQQAELPCAFKGGYRSVFKTPIVPESDLPALLGLELLDSSSAVIDSRHNRLILPGPGGYKMSLSPGSISMSLERALSGHLLLPCTHFQEKCVQGPSGKILQQ
jgi:hypothetical protein